MLMPARQIEATSVAFASWKSTAHRIEELEHGEQDRLRLLDLWTFQKREIEDAKLHPAKTNASKPRSAFWRMRRRFTARP